MSIDEARLAEEFQTITVDVPVDVEAVMTRGRRLRRRRWLDAAGAVAVVVAVGAAVVALAVTAPGFAPGNKSYMHLCLEVDDCFAAAKELEARGLDIWAKPKVGTDHNVQCWTRDPDGNLIEIMQISPESPQAKCR